MEEVLIRMRVTPVAALDLIRKMLNVTIVTFDHYKNECPILKKKEASSSNVVSVIENTNNRDVVLVVSGSSGYFDDK